ncbi:MAG: bifunctional folylpolyglutamate synthase/dihydrofolate synthase [Endomicrobiales bacterium]|nr:bifunctional folylpolyglutamate synthase/dihydrofolate synthase [Endomicrobiales bacterium]
MRILDTWQKTEYTKMQPGLQRIQNFLERADNPQNTFKSFHIAGTNGKGSTAAVIANILVNSGYKTALYTSPHLINISERININGIPITASELEKLTRKNLRLAKSLKLTFFEFITALAFLHFRNNKVDVAVIETGLGGRFDATNVINSPLACVITEIALEHKGVLGNTIKKIAYEKAGIIKNSVPVICGTQNPAALKVIYAVCKTNNATLYAFGKDFCYKNYTQNFLGSNASAEFFYNGVERKFKVVTNLIGTYQAKNCSCALGAIEAQKELSVKSSAMLAGAKTVTWPARFDVREINKKTFIFDGAHNPQAMKCFADMLKITPYSKPKPALLFGVMADKDFYKIIKQAAVFCDKVVLVRAKNARSLDLNKLSLQWQKHLPKENIFTATTLKTAMSILKDSKVIVVTGSLYLVADCFKYFKLKTSKE